MAGYAVVNTDLMSATDVRSGMRSFRYGSIDPATKEFTGKEIENASIVALDSLIDPNQDLWLAVDPTASTPLEDLVLVATPEIMYDERLKNLNQFINEPDTNCTGMLLHKNDIFSATVEAFDAEPKVGDKITVQAGTKMKVGGTGTQIGVVTDIRIHNRIPYYGVKVG